MSWLHLTAARFLITHPHCITSEFKHFRSNNWKICCQKCCLSMINICCCEREGPQAGGWRLGRCKANEMLIERQRPSFSPTHLNSDSQEHGNRGEREYRTALHRAAGSLGSLSSDFFFLLFSCLSFLLIMGNSVWSAVMSMKISAHSIIKTNKRASPNTLSHIHTNSASSGH